MSQKTLFSLDENYQEFASCISNEISTIYDIDSDLSTLSSHILISSDISADSVLSLAFSHLSGVYSLSDTINKLTDKLAETAIDISSNTLFSPPAGFAVHHCPVMPSSTESAVDTRKRYKPDKVQQDMISTMYSSLLIDSTATKESKKLDTISEIQNSTIELLEEGYNKINITDIISRRNSIITTASLQNFLISFASILEKLKFFQCNLYYKQLRFDGKMAFHNTVNVYPELPAFNDAEDNVFYSAVLASPLAKYYAVDMSTSSFLKTIFSLTDEANTQINTITNQKLVYTNVNYNTYQSFDVMSFNGTNGRIDCFPKITTKDFDLKSYVNFVIDTFNIKPGIKISAKKVKQAILFLLDIWQRNIQTFQIDLYLCHYNCHTNNLLEDTLTDSLIQDYYYKVEHVIQFDTFPAGIIDVIDLVSHTKYYKFASSAPASRSTNESDYHAARDRVPIELTYPIYTGSNLDTDIPVTVKCIVTNIFGNTTPGNTKIINSQEVYHITRNVNTIQLEVQDQGYDSSDNLCPGKDITSPTQRTSFSENNVINCVGDIQFIFSFLNTKLTKVYQLEIGNPYLNDVSEIKTGYIYQIDSNTDFAAQPSYINMAKRQVFGHQETLPYATTYQPSPINGDFEILYHFPSNRVSYGSPGYYERLSNYISAIRDETNTVISSIQITDAQAFNGNTLNTDVYPQFTCSYENAGVIGENRVVSITPHEYSEFTGYLTASYEIKGLTKVAFTDTNKMYYDWNETAKAEMGDYTQGSGPFTPGVRLAEKQENNADPIDIPETLYNIEYINNNPTTEITQNLIARITPTTLGKIFYLEDPLELQCKLKPLPSDTSIDYGDYAYQFNFGSWGPTTLSENSWWKYGYQMSWDETKDEAGGDGESKTLTEIKKDDGTITGYKIAGDDKARTRIFVSSATLPSTVERVLIKYRICRPWKYDHAVVGAVMMLIDGITVWTDLYSGRVRSHVHDTNGIVTQFIDGQTSLKISAGETHNIAAKSVVIAPNHGVARFVSVSVWYTTEEIRIDKQYEAACIRRININYNNTKNTGKPTPSGTWASTFSTKSVQAQDVIGTINGSKFTEYFSSHKKVKYYISQKEIRWNKSWKITINSTDPAYNTSIIVTYSDDDITKDKPETLNWNNIYLPTFSSDDKATQTSILNSITSITLEPLRDTYFQSKLNVTYNIDVAVRNKWSKLPPNDFQIDAFCQKVVDNSSIPLEQAAYFVPDDKRAIELNISKFCIGWTLTFNDNPLLKVNNTYYEPGEDKDRDSSKTFDSISLTFNEQIKNLAGQQQLTSMQLIPLSSTFDEAIPLTMHYDNGEYADIVWHDPTCKDKTLHKTRYGLMTGQIGLPRIRLQYDLPQYAYNRMYNIGWKATIHRGAITDVIHPEFMFTEPYTSTNVTISADSAKLANVQTITSVDIYAIPGFFEKILSSEVVLTSYGKTWSCSIAEEENRQLVTAKAFLDQTYDIDRFTYQLSNEAGTEFALATNKGFTVEFQLDSTDASSTHRENLMYVDTEPGSINTAFTEDSRNAVSLLFDSWQKRQKIKTTFKLTPIINDRDSELKPAEPSSDPEPEDDSDDSDDSDG